MPTDVALTPHPLRYIGIYSRRKKVYPDLKAPQKIKKRVAFKHFSACQQIGMPICFIYRHAIHEPDHEYFCNR